MGYQIWCPEYNLITTWKNHLSKLRPFYFFYCSQSSFCFLKNKPNIDVLESINYVAFWTNLESISFCILNNLFPSITWLCAYCVQVWITLLCIRVRAVIILCTSFKIITSLFDMSSPIFKILLGSQDFIKQIKINIHKYKTKPQLWQN